MRLCPMGLELPRAALDKRSATILRDGSRRDRTGARASTTTRRGPKLALQQDSQEIEILPGS